jgi:hypothetical protein
VDFIFDLQLFGGGKGGGGSTTVTNRQPTEAENALTEQALAYSQAVSPNALTLNDKAAGLLFNSIGDTQQNFNALNQNAQNQIANATRGMSGLVGSNNAATTSANNALDAYGTQYSNVANAANNGLSGYSTQYGNATNAANAANNSYANQYGSANTAANKTLGNLSTQYGNAANAANKSNSGYSTQYGNAATTANGLLGSLSPQYQSAANQANTTLSSLANGVIPTQYQQNMENSISTALKNTMGNTINNLGRRGVLNSSVTNSALNDIAKNASDTVAQQYQNNISQIGNLANQQFSNTNTALGAQGTIAQQKLGNTNTALGAQQGITQQNLGNTNTALGQQGNLAQQQLGNTQSTLGAQSGLSNQNLANTSNMLSAQTGLTNQQATNSNNALNSMQGLTQQQLQNLLGTNSANGAVYQNLLGSATAPITTAAAAQEAAQSPALNLWNASLGLNGATTGALAASAGQGTTTSTTTNSGGGGLFSGLLGGLF